MASSQREFVSVFEFSRFEKKHSSGFSHCVFDTARVTGPPSPDYVGVTAGVPQMADDLVRRTKSAESGQ
jgi:hypothetical protein